jgi:hypothetical protein
VSSSRLRNSRAENPCGSPCSGTCLSRRQGELRCHSRPPLLACSSRPPLRRRVAAQSRRAARLRRRSISSPSERSRPPKAAPRGCAETWLCSRASQQSNRGSPLVCATWAACCRRTDLSIVGGNKSELLLHDAVAQLAQGLAYEAFDIDSRFRVLLLDSTPATAAAGEAAAAGVTGEQLQWLSDKLDGAVKDGRHVVIFMYHSAFPFVASRDKSTGTHLHNDVSFVTALKPFAARILAVITTRRSPAAIDTVSVHTWPASQKHESDTYPEGCLRFITLEALSRQPVAVLSNGSLPTCVAAPWARLQLVAGALRLSGMGNASFTLQAASGTECAVTQGTSAVPPRPSCKAALKRPPKKVLATAVASEQPADAQQVANATTDETTAAALPKRRGRATDFEAAATAGDEERNATKEATVATTETAEAITSNESSTAPLKPDVTTAATALEIDAAGADQNATQHAVMNITTGAEEQPTAAATPTPPVRGLRGQLEVPALLPGQRKAEKKTTGAVVQATQAESVALSKDRVATSEPEAAMNVTAQSPAGENNGSAATEASPTAPPTTSLSEAGASEAHATANATSARNELDSATHTNTSTGSSEDALHNVTATATELVGTPENATSTDERTTRAPRRRRTTPPGTADAVEDKLFERAVATEAAQGTGSYSPDEIAAQPREFKRSRKPTALPIEKDENSAGAEATGLPTTAAKRRRTARPTKAADSSTADGAVADASSRFDEAKRGRRQGGARRVHDHTPDPPSKGSQDVVSRADASREFDRRGSRHWRETRPHGSRRSQYTASIHQGAPSHH